MIASQAARLQVLAYLLQHLYYSHGRFLHDQDQLLARHATIGSRGGLSMKVEIAEMSLQQPQRNARIEPNTLATHSQASC
ncbi:MAG: hypothetical protein N838_16860 [Thiohalocapsa sp. PB-PSB1]|nr:MAG: hypothetical protein N838_16860 [Thiohalocapsa sp. PB-PSB1]